MSVSVVALQQHHLEDAANLVVKGYEGQREIVSALPSCRYDTLELIETRLRGLLDRFPGAAALRGDKLVGFAQGMAVPSLHGRRSAYVPEWGHAADANPVPIYQAMYDYLAPRWMQEGCRSHVVTLFCRSGDLICELFHCGFGMVVIDAVRDLSPVEGNVAKIQIREACPGDIGVLLEFEENLTEHLASAPIFRRGGKPPDADEVDRLLRDPGHLYLLACEHRQVLGYMRFGPKEAGSLQPFIDDKSVACTGAYVRRGLRRRGVGAALLARAFDWARRAGYERCTVDFESANVFARRFWLRHFDPITFSLVRHVGGSGSQG